MNDKSETALSFHTPGPWTKRLRQDTYVIDGNGCEGIAVAFNEKDASLISAAPAMLQALKLNDALIREGPKTDAELREAMYATRVAIAKATGSS